MHSIFCPSAAAPQGPLFIPSMILSWPQMKPDSYPISALNTDKSDQASLIMTLMHGAWRGLSSVPRPSHPILSQLMRQYPGAGIRVKKIISSANGSASFVAVQVDLSVQLLCHDHGKNSVSKHRVYHANMAQPRLREKKGKRTQKNNAQSYKRKHIRKDMII